MPPVHITEYPKYIELDGKQVRCETEEEFKCLSLDPEKEAIKKDLAENYGQEIDLAEFDGVAGMGALRALYEAIKSSNPTVTETVKTLEPVEDKPADKPAKKTPPKL